MARPSSACAQVTGSTSSAVRSRPAIVASLRRSYAVLAASTVVKCTSSAMSSSGAGDAGSTVWPSDASSAAASSAAAVHAGSTGTNPAGAVALSTPTRNAPGAAPTSSRNGRLGGAAAYGSPGIAPASASSIAALSRTERVTTWRTTSPAHASPSSGPSEMRPRVGFSPNRPHALAGMRMEPPPSPACATGTMPDATAARCPRSNRRASA